ncbi:MAG TPA: M4 family metallopeptidase [Thermoanaerobaculia bacterium]|nr:M4 family metallopeptidase [Thermoanaerobaculia bacterium]
MRGSAVCSIIPPHILRNIAESGDEDARRNALAALETTAHARGQRAVLAEMSRGIGVPAGEKRRTIYDARNTRDLPGKLVRGEGQDAVRDVAVNEAFDGAGKTYDFYKRVYGRNSVDDRGLRLDGTVHYGVRYENALWNGRQMIYGDGDGRYFNRFTECLDVIAHELTHGVTQYTAALEYDAQSGALNEHFSDVFGILTKQYAHRQTAAKSNWLIGEGIFTKKVHGAAIRSMKAPGTAYDDPVIGKDPQPSRMKDYVATELDNGGVHVNSGIPNRAFYEISILLGGKAWEIAGKIWYRALARELRARASFQDCADATWRAAGDLFGAGSGPQHAVLAAWKTVGITAAPAVMAGGPRVPVKERFSPPAGAAELPLSVPLVRITEV